MKFLITLGYLFSLGVILPASAQDEAVNNIESSSWELGVGVALVSLPHYPGASQSSTLIAPFPYPVYHSEHFNLDEEGLIASVAESGRFSLKASVNGSLPVSDRDNKARIGMDDLDLVVETGPSLHISLAQWGQSELRLELPLRAAFRVTTDDFPKYSGWTSNPGLYYETDFGEWHWESSIGGIWSNSDYHGFFYDVAPDFATAGRPAYSSKGGFTAMRSSFTLKRRWGNFIGIGYARYMNFSGAANTSSPLLIQSDYLAGGISLVYMLFSSK